MKTIPKALVNLKNDIAGSQWPKIRRYLIRYMEYKHKLLEIKDVKTRKFFDELTYRFYADGINNIAWDGSIPTEHLWVIVSHLHNVLSTLWKEEYRSDLVCYIADSYATNIPSGNKKYPNL